MKFFYSFLRPLWKKPSGFAQKANLAGLAATILINTYLFGQMKYPAVSSQQTLNSSQTLEVAGKTQLNKEARLLDDIYLEKLKDFSLPGDRLVIIGPDGKLKSGPPFENIPPGGGNGGGNGQGNAGIAGSAVKNSPLCNGSSIFRIQYRFTGQIDGCTTESSTWDLSAIKENDTKHRFEITTPEFAGPILSLTNEGNAGIGTNNPLAKLDVAGSGLFSGNVGIGVSSALTRLQVNGTGYFTEKIGIGTSAPSAMIEVRKDVYSDEGQVIKIRGLDDGGNTGLLMINDSPYNFTRTSVIFANSATNPHSQLDAMLQVQGGSSAFYLRSQRVGGNFMDHFTINLGSNNIVFNSFKTGGAPAFGNVIVANGNMGIGTTQPSEKMVINGNLLVKDNYDLLLRNYHHGLGWYGEDNITPSKKFDNVNINGPVLYGENGGALGIKRLEEDGNDIGNYVEIERVALRWTEDGKVGVGIKTPSAKLQVNVFSETEVAFAIYKEDTEQFRIMGDGKFYARGYILKLGSFPDYAFAKDYKKMTPQEKTKYFEIHHHLPYLPSAKEIEKDGLDIGDGLIGITRNVEENSLDINTLFEIVRVQKEEIEKLKKQIEDCNYSK